MKKVICWWSGGVTSAVACKLAIDLYGAENCRVIFIDTKNEDDDTYRFMRDCEKWYGIPIEIISSDKYDSIQEVWDKHNSLNVANGAICSSTLKREVREKWQKDNIWEYQVFGFDLDEAKRAKGMTINHPKVKAIYPLMMYGLFKKDCIDIIEESGIEVPLMYHLGFLNNNCFKTGCVQGGIGYWQKIKREYPDKFNDMAEREHRYTDNKGKPVTMLRVKVGDDYVPLFLTPHLGYPNLPKFEDRKGIEPKPLFECNGFCGINDLEERNYTEKEINYQFDLFENNDQT